MEVDDGVEVAPKENPMELESEEGELSDDDGEIQADVLEDASLSDPLKKPEIPGIRVFCPLVNYCSYDQLSLSAFSSAPIFRFCLLSFCFGGYVVFCVMRLFSNIVY